MAGRAGGPEWQSAAVTVVALRAGQDASPSRQSQVGALSWT
jgi:hypothetical protein